MQMEVTIPRRQAMLEIVKPHFPDGAIEAEEVTRVPVLVWPIPTMEGFFVVERQDGTAQVVHPDFLAFLGSKELFDQYEWGEA